MNSLAAGSLVPSISGAQVVLSCLDLNASIRFLTEEVGFKVRMIMPADTPVLAVLEGHGCLLRLERASAGMEAKGAPFRLRLVCDPTRLPAGVPAVLRGPDGIEIFIASSGESIHVPAGTQEFVVTRLEKTGGWAAGRADMLYRDLIPSRLGGRFVASHIRIEAGGPVPDYVHYHRIRFQVIYCRRGSIRLVYEDQGAPFVLNAGDCVLQPPEIRHRVLEASAGAEVVEVGCPAVHETCGDPGMMLSTALYSPNRSYGNQRFVRHVAETADWVGLRQGGFEVRDTGIAEATRGLGSVRVLRPRAGALEPPAGAGRKVPAESELLFLFVLTGDTRLESQALGGHGLAAGDSCVLPAGADYRFSPSPGLELLEVSVPALVD